MKTKTVKSYTYLVYMYIKKKKKYMRYFHKWFMESLDISYENFTTY